MAFKLADKQKVSAAIAISCAFFVCELAGWSPNLPLKHSNPSLTVTAVAFKTGSLALMADAFHYVS
jgi:zinc transporter 1